MQWIMYAMSLVFLSLSYVGSAVRTSKLLGTEPEYQGTFDLFLKKFLFLLSGGEEKAVKEICKIFQKYLKSMGYRRYTRKLAKLFKKLSHKDQDEIMSELQEYRDALENKTDKLIAFFKAINAAFTLQQRIRFDDYLNDMENYIRGDKRLINEETRKLLNDVILKSILGLSKRDRIDLEKKLKKMIKEHEEGSDGDIDLLLSFTAHVFKIR